MTENQIVWKSANQGFKEDTFIETGRRSGNKQLGRVDLWHSSGWRAREGKTAAGRPSEAADCGVGWARLQLAGKEAAGGPSSRLSNLGLQLGEIKPQTTELKTPVRVVVATGETPSLTGEFVGETHRAQEHTQTHTMGSSTRKDQFDCG